MTETPTDENVLKAELTTLFTHYPVMQDHHVELVFIDSNEYRDMWHLVIEVDKMDFDTMEDLIEDLKVFWCCEGKEYAKRLADGRVAQIGDGDDSLAAWFEAGKFIVWLRVWPLGSDQACDESNICESNVIPLT